ncbi:MAG: hypothetical protein U0804_13830 [Gemmataceae bacterium]
MFALGGILTFILTGRPPYVGRTSREVWEKAAAGDLADAAARLDAVGGAGRLPAVATRCLSADPGFRFAHAGEVRAAVHDALLRAEQVRRQGELDSAASAAATSERFAYSRARRALQLGFGGVLVGVFVVAAAWDHLQSRANEAALKKQFPVLIDAIAGGVDSGRFDSGSQGDREFRKRLSDRLDASLKVLDPPEKLKARLVRRVMQGGFGTWADLEERRRVVELYKETYPGRTALDFDIDAVVWFGSQKPIRGLERQVLVPATASLWRAVGREETPEDVRRRAGDALRGVVENAEGQEQIKWRLVLAAVCEAAGDEDRAGREWAEAANRLPTSGGSRSEVTLAGEAVGWFGSRGGVGAVGRGLELPILRRAVRVLERVADDQASPEAVRDRAGGALLRARSTEVWREGR